MMARTRFYMVLQGKGKSKLWAQKKKELFENDITLAPSGQEHGVMK